jgi:hypothetical protein
MADNWPTGSYDYFGQPVAAPTTPPSEPPAGPGQPYSYAVSAAAMPAPPPLAPGWPDGAAAVLAAPGAPQQTVGYQQAWQHPGWQPPAAAVAAAYAPVGKGRLGFFDSVRSGWQLAGTCGRVLAADKFLVLIPMLAITIGIAIAVPYVGFLGGLEAFFAGGRVDFAVRAFPLLVALHIVGVFGNAAVVAAATVRLEGGTPRLEAAWAKALAHAPMLFVYGFVSAVQRTLTGLLRSGRGRGLGDLAANAIDRGWDFATFLAIPVLLYEGNTGVFTAVKRSANLVRKRWGSQLMGQSTLNLAVMIVGLPVMLGLGMIGFLVHPMVGVALFVLAYLGVSAVAAALGGIFSAAMYRFAITGQVAPGFREADMWAPFRRR